MTHATFITARRIALAIGLLIALNCGSRSVKGDDPRDVQMADLQRQVDELGMMVRQMQDPRSPFLVPA